MSIVIACAATAVLSFIVGTIFGGIITGGEGEDAYKAGLQVGAADEIARKGWEELPVDVDDTELVQAAIDAAASGDGIVRLEVGRAYRVPVLEEEL